MIDPKLQAYRTARDRERAALGELQDHMKRLYPPGEVLSSGHARFLGLSVNLAGAVIDLHLGDLGSAATTGLPQEPGVQVILAAKHGSPVRVCYLTYQQLLERDENSDAVYYQQLLHLGEIDDK